MKEQVQAIVSKPIVRGVVSRVVRGARIAAAATSMLIDVQGTGIVPTEADRAAMRKLAV